MSKPTQWNEIDFASPEHVVPEYKEHHRRLGFNELYLWYRAEIRQRRAAKVTENEVIGWLKSEGLDSVTITWLMVWAETDDTFPMPHAPVHPGLVIGVETHSQAPAFFKSSPFVPGAGRVYTDPVESVRARADARRDRATASGEEVHDLPAPEFRFVKPADADEAWRSQHAYDMGTVVKGMILVIIILIVIVLGVIVASIV